MPRTSMGKLASSSLCCGSQAMCSRCRPSMWPDSGVSTPASALMSVLLPAPLGPTTATNAPGVI